MTAPPRPGPCIEVATWVPLRTAQVGPWRVGLSEGFTRRGNSAHLTDPDADGAVAALDGVEERYEAAGQRAIVRLATPRSPEPAPPGLVASLDARGYRTVSTTAVLARTVDTVVPRVDGARLDLAETPGDAWLAGWLGTKAVHTDRSVARRLLTGSQAVYVTALEGNRVLGTIRAARAGHWVGLSCLTVAASERRRGLGTWLTRAALAADPEASHAFLQVEVHHTGALALYRGLGFVEVDEYCYYER
ncbi:GNAT family N-acetyltransferase [Actinotalea lenta]|uniref:GNAT family N-acetyltransferase n=1 Tax=Actinotalea lenta TaxID=3064654 RepID=UPI002729EA6D|nr:GNAT family N-acetyltransferase [Isoptericola sp. b490]